MSWFTGFQDLIRFDEEASDSIRPVWRKDGSSRWGYIFPLDLGAPENLWDPGNLFRVSLWMNQEQVVNTRINSIFGFSEENACVNHDTEVLLCSCWFSSDFYEQL